MFKAVKRDRSIDTWMVDCIYSAENLRVELCGGQYFLSDITTTSCMKLALCHSE